MRIFIEPTDVLLFRDGKPFSAGDDHLARSLFPPTPMPFQGALRSLILARHGFRFTDEVRKLIGEGEEYGQFRMKGPFLAEHDGSGAIEEYFPVPADVVIPRDESDESKKEKSHLLRPVQSFWRTDLDLPVITLWAKNKDRSESAEGFVSESELVNYLCGDPPQVSKASEFACTESRTGIKRKTATHSAESGRLYSVAFSRLKSDVGFTVDVEGIPLENKGLLMLGGESRTARYEKVDERTWAKDAADKIKAKLAENKPLRFKLYLATPAFFKKGWLPDSFDEGIPKGALGEKKLKLKLVAAAIKRPLPLGGWDLKKKEPKPIEKAVPAGSVYYFEALDPGVTADDLFAALNFKCISDKHSQIGFGLSLIGGWSS